MSLSVRRSTVAAQRVAWLCLIGGFAACQPLDEAAARGEPFVPEDQGSGAGLQSSAIGLPDGGLAQDACAATERQANDILEHDCARCHGGDSPGARQGAPPFDCVLDSSKLVTMTSATVTDPSTSLPARFLVPGDPDHSRIYLRILHDEMPPPDVVGLPPNPRPSASDLSVLRHWIEHCVPSPDTQGDDAGVSDTDER